MKQINLYQAEFRPIKVVLPARALALGVLGLAAALLAFYGWQQWELQRFRQDVARVVAQAEQVAGQTTAGAPPRLADPHLQAEAAALEARLATLERAQAAVAAGALGSPAGYGGHFRALAKAAGPGAWLTRVEVAGLGKELTLQGRALAGEDTARLIARLGGQPEFTGLDFALLDVAPPAERPEGEAAPRFLAFTLAARRTAPALPGGKP
ncbi:MAG: PilN domain-containing protein [Pseudomonadota bacterium]